MYNFNKCTNLVSKYIKGKLTNIIEFKFPSLQLQLN